MSGKTARAHRKNVPRVKARQTPAEPARPRARLVLTTAIVVVAAAVGLYFVSSFRHDGGSTGAANAAAYPYAVGSPGVGAPAPEVRLPSSAGGNFDLARYRGHKPVLLYFQEGLTCQPCWDQITAIQRAEAKFHALGIGPIVSITTDPLAEITQKAHDQALTIPVLSDRNGTVSDRYSARDYGMMGHARDGHSFVLVGRDGKIRWRADYGGAPKYTMFVPVDVLLAQLKRGTGGRA